MSEDAPYEPLATPRCCELGAANLEWFPRSGARGAWHVSSFGWDARESAPTSDAYRHCPFCGEKLPEDPRADGRDAVRR